MITAIRRAVLLLVLMVVPLLAGVAGRASASAADTGWPPIIETGGGTGVTNPQPEPIDNPGEPGGSTPLPPTTTITGFALLGQPPITATTICSALGDGRVANGYNWSMPADPATGIGMGPPSFICAYPPAPVDRTIFCPVDGVITATGPNLNPSVPSTTVQVIEVRSPFVSGGERDPSLCTTGLKVTASTPLTAYGHWTLSGTYRVESCTVRSFPGTSQPDRIIGCGVPVVTTSQAVGTLFCQGWSASRVTVNPATGKPLLFTADDCRSSTAGLWSCPSMTAKIDGGGATASVLDDGLTHKIAWTAAQPTGLRNVKVTGSSVAATAGTPSKNVSTGAWQVAVGGTGNPVSPSYTSATDLASVTAAWFAAGVPGSPSVITKTTTFSAQAPSIAVTVTGIDLATGTATYATSTDWTATTGTCQGTAAVSVYRVRTTSN